MNFDGSSNGSFSAPYYRSAEYQTRYPAYLRPVAAPPPVTVTSQNSLYPRWYGVRKMSTTGFRSEATKFVGFTDLVDVTPSAAVTSKKRKSVNKKRRRSRKAEVVDVLDYDHPSQPADEDHSLGDMKPTPLSPASHNPVIEEYYAHALTTDISNPISNLSLPPPPPPPPPPLSSPPQTPQIYRTSRVDPSTQRRRAGGEDHSLHNLKTPTIISSSAPLPPSPPPADQEDFPPTKFVPPIPPPPPPADKKDNACINIHLPPPQASGDSQLHPVELLKQTAKRFRLECERRHRSTAVQKDKAQARNIAEQAKHVVMAAKRGWSYDGDKRKGITWTDDEEEASTVVRLPEYAELERLGLGKYDSSGRWVPSSNMLKKRFLSFR